MKQRASGEKVWEFRFYESDSAGKRQRRAVTVGTLQQYASESAARKSPLIQGLLLRLNAGNPATVTAKITFGAVLGRYEKEELPERWITRSVYQSLIRKHIRPRWAEYELAQIKPLLVEAWLKELKLKPKSKSHIRNLMHVIFECARRWEVTDRNPIAQVRVKGGSRRSKSPVVLTVEEFSRLVPSLKEPFRTMVLVAGWLGLRVSEIAALKWSDFNFGDKCVMVQRGVVHGHVDDVKTEYSRDRLPVDAALLQELLAHRGRWFQAPDQWVFGNPKTAKPYHPMAILRRQIRPAAVAAGLGDEIGWHTFRHSYRSWLDEAGASMKVQQELMRHADIQTTMNVYGKAMAGSKREANSKVVAMSRRVFAAERPSEVPDGSYRESVG